MIKNVIFDFYGTLFDIKTNEEKISLWRKMASLYSVYGCDYKAKELKMEYEKAVAAETHLLTKNATQKDLEIELRKVFVDLLVNCKNVHPTFETINGISQSEWLNPTTYMRGILEYSDWCAVIANLFRIESREKGKTYPYALEVLQELKKQGYHLYLLSNAQSVFTNPEMDQSGIRPYMDAIFLSSDFGVRKPNPRFMKLLLKENKLKHNECIMVGNDFTSDIRIAMEADMPSIFLNTDGYSKHDLKEKIKPFKQKGYIPQVIEDGDIRKILRGNELCHNG